MDDTTLRGTLKNALTAALAGTAGPELSFGGEKIEFVLFDRWAEAPEKDGSTGERGPDDKSDTAPDEGEVIGFGHGEPAPASFFVRVRLPRLGTIGVLIMGTDPAFERLSIHITPLHPPSLRLISARLEQWYGQLAGDLPGLEGLKILPPEQGSRASVDFTA
jgi:hypothetical protein